MNALLVSIVATLAIQALASMAVFAPPVFAPVAAPELGIEAAWAGVSTSLIYLAAILSALASGGFIARLGPIRTSQVCLVFSAVGMAAMASGFLPLVALGALLLGIGYGGLTPASSVVLNERTPPNWLALVFSIKQTGVPIGGALAGVLVPPMMVSIGWRGAALAIGAGCLVLVALVQPVRADTDRERNRNARLGRIRLREPMRLVWSVRELREMALASFTYSGMQMCLGSYLVVCLHEVADASVSAAGAALSTAMAGAVVGRIGWGIVADRFVAPRTMLGLLGVGMSVAAFAMPLVGAQWPWLAILALSLVFGATAVGWNGVYLSQVALVAPPGRAADATGASLAMTYLGVFTMPLLIWGVVQLGFGYGWGFVLVGLCSLWRASYFFRGERRTL